MAGTTPSQGIPYADRPDAFQLTADLKGSFNKIDSVFAQTRGESTAALTAATAAEVAAGQAVSRVNLIEEPIHVGPSAPTDGEELWVDTEAASPPAGGGSWDDITDKPTSFPPSAHTHDDRYYTESEIDQKIADAVAGLSFNTGWITVTPDAGVTGTIKVKRQGGGGGDRTTIRLEGVLPPAGVGSAYLVILPAGFRHTTEHWFLADGRSGEAPSVIGLYNGSRAAWVMTVDTGTTRPTDPITGEYTWESPDARPAI